MLSSQPPLITLTIAGNVHCMSLLQLANVLLDLLPPACHFLSVLQASHLCLEACVQTLHLQRLSCASPCASWPVVNGCPFVILSMQWLAWICVHWVDQTLRAGTVP